MNPLQVFITSQSIGQGRHARVHVGLYDNKKVAVKVYTEEKDQYTVRHEAAVHQNLRHPHIVRCLGLTHIAFETIGLVLELLENQQQLRDALARGLTVGQKITISRDICSAMLYIIGIGIFHRSLHTRNVLISNTFRATIIDFGNVAVGGPINLKSLEMHCRHHIATILNTINTGPTTTDETLDAAMSRLTLQSSPIINAINTCRDQNLSSIEFKIKLCDDLNIPRNAATDQSSPDELFTLAQNYEKVEIHYEKAAECYLKAALKGHAESQYIIGIKYETLYNGFFLYDVRRAFYWLTQAANQGNRNALMKMRSHRRFPLETPPEVTSSIQLQTQSAAAAAACDTASQIP